MSDIEDMFDDKKLKKSVRKARVKSTIKIIIIATIVFVVGSFLNTFISLKYSAKMYEMNEAYVSMSVPNGYISESNDIIGFLGGNGTYKIAKKVDGKPVILEDRTSLFGLVPQMNYTRFTGAGYHIAGEWPVEFWENGYKKLRLFHPELQYKEYQNDLAEIEKIPDGKVIEMAISFDKPYKVTDLYTIQNKLKPASITWMWLNEFTEEKMKEYQYEIENYDAKANGVAENDAIGLSAPDGKEFNYNPYEEKYDELLKKLGKSYMPEHKTLYKEIIARGKTSIEDAEILGVIVNGTKEELKELVGNPMIKATSIGVVVDPVY